MKRPTAITSISVLLLLAGFLMLILLIYRYVYEFVLEPKYFGRLIIPTVLPFAFLISGIGLVMGKRWGWWASSILTIYICLACILLMIMKQLSQNYFQKTSIGIPVFTIMLTYIGITLLQPQTTEHFGFTIEKRRKALKIIGIITFTLIAFNVMRIITLLNI